MGKNKQGTQVPGKVEETSAPPGPGEQIQPESGDVPPVLQGEPGGETTVSPMATTEPPEMVDAAGAQALLDEAALKLEEANDTIAKQTAELVAKNDEIDALETEVAAMKDEIAHLRENVSILEELLGKEPKDREAAKPTEPRVPRGKFVATRETGVLRKATGQVMPLTMGEALPADADDEDLAAGLKLGIYAPVES